MFHRIQQCGVAARQNRIAALALVTFICCATTSARAQVIPTDAEPYCAVTPAAFSQWFQSGSPTLNGMVLPANSLAFSNPPKKNCAFYQWAEQMFLWLTSPIPPGSAYGAGSSPGARIFDSTAFFDVSPPQNCNLMNQQLICTRTLVPHPVGPAFIRSVVPRTTKPGPHGLPLVAVRRGQPVEVVPQRLGATGKALVTDARGKPAEVARVVVDRKAHATLYDARGERIALPLSAASPRGGHTHVAMSIPDICNAGAVCKGTEPGQLVDTVTGSVLQTESGQATGSATAPQGGGVLEPGGAAVQPGSTGLVYYSIIVNDVFAYFVTGYNAGAISPMPTQFPTKQADLSSILTYAASQGVTSFPDQNALTVELKTSWIDASTLPQGAVAGYITTQGMVPTYTQTPASWTPDGQKRVTLALVGMHVVGSVFGHPEMIFATFEHIGNAPNAQYSYISTTRRPPFRTSEVPVPQNTNGSWLLFASGSGSPVNVPHMVECEPSGVIYPIQTAPCPLVAPAQGNFSISPSNTLRQKPWGSASDQAPNPNASSPAMSNSQVISVNSSVQNLMTAAGASADVRNNYMLIGATWTLGGAAPGIAYGLPYTKGMPPTCFYGSGTADCPGPPNVVGTSQLFNTTMETYDQGGGSTFIKNNGPGFSCFDCHSSQNLAPSELSHIFSQIAATQVPK